MSDAIRWDEVTVEAHAAGYTIRIPIALDEHACLAFCASAVDGLAEAIAAQLPAAADDSNEPEIEFDDGYRNERGTLVPGTLLLDLPTPFLDAVTPEWLSDQLAPAAAAAERAGIAARSAMTRAADTWQKRARSLAPTDSR